MLISAARSHTHPRWGERVLGMQPTWAQRHPAHAAASLLAHSTTLSSATRGNEQRGRGRGWTGHEGMRYAPCVSCRRSRGEVETCMTLLKGDGESVYGAVCALCFALWLPGGCKRLCWGRGCLAPCCERGKRVRFVPLAAPGPVFLLPQHSGCLMPGASFLLGNPARARRIQTPAPALLREQAALQPRLDGLGPCRHAAGQDTAPELSGAVKTRKSCGCQAFSSGFGCGAVLLLCLGCSKV